MIAMVHSNTVFWNNGISSAPAAAQMVFTTTRERMPTMPGNRKCQGAFHSAVATSMPCRAACRT